MEKEKIVCPNCQAEVSLEASIFQKYLEMLKENEELKTVNEKLRLKIDNLGIRTCSLEAEIKSLHDKLERKIVDQEINKPKHTDNLANGDFIGTKLALPGTLELIINIRSSGENKES